MKSPEVETAPAAPRNPARQASALVLGTTLATLSGLLLPLALVRLMGKADIAELMALVLIYDMVALLATAGFAQTLMYHLSGRSGPERRSVAVRIGWIMAGLGAAGALIITLIGLLGNEVRGAVAAGGSELLSMRPLLVLAPSLVLDLPSRLVPNLLVAENRAREASILGVLRTIVTTLMTLIPVALGQSIVSVAIWYSLTRCLFGLSFPWALRLVFPGVPRAPCRVSVRELFRFALPLGMTDAVSLLNQQFDRWLILLSFPAAAFADYQAGAWQIPILSTIAYSVGAAYMPLLVEAFGRGAPREALAIWRGTIGKVSLLVVPITMGFVVGAKELMALLFTEAYAGAAPIFQLYSVLTLGRVATFGSVLVAAGRPRYLLQSAVFALVVNIVLCVPLTLLLGFIGPALGTALAFLPMVVFYVWSIARASGVPMREILPLATYFRVLLLSCLASGAALLVKQQLSLSNATSLAVCLFVTLALFAALGTVTGTITGADWRFARDWLRLKLAR